MATKKAPSKNLFTREPILTVLVVPVLIGLAARFGFDVDEDTAFQIAGGLWAIGALVVRTWFATPTADPHDNLKRPLVPKLEGPTTREDIRRRRRE